MTPRILEKGANVELASLGSDLDEIIVVIETDSAGGTVSPDASILILGTDGRVRSNDDLIFYNQPTGVDGAVRLLDQPVDEGATETRRDAIAVSLPLIPDDVGRILIGASTDEDGASTFGHAASVKMSLADSEDATTPLIEYPIVGLATEKALIFGELYRRAGNWKVRAVGQGYAGGLAALVTDFGIEVDDDPEEPEHVDQPDSVDSESEQHAIEPVTTEPESAEPPPASVAIAKRRRAPRMPRDWADRESPYQAVTPPEPWRSARLFPTVGIKTAAEQEGRATSILLSVIEVVREFGRPVVSAMGGPGGRIETFTEPVFTLSGKDVRPDGLIRVTRGAKSWTALIEVKTNDRKLSLEQVENYLTVAKSKNFDAVVTISSDLMPTADECPLSPNIRLLKNVTMTHLSWEELVTEAALAHNHSGVDDRTRERILREFLLYATAPSSGMTIFNDMGRHWVPVREAVKNKTMSAGDAGAIDVCDRFDRLIRHTALQLSVLLGQRVTSVVPAEHRDAVSRVRQLADSGELFGTLRIAGAVGPIFIHANLATERVGCAITTPAPRSGRPTTKVNWLVRQLADADPKTRLTAHHAGSRTEKTSALLHSVREEPTALQPPDGRDIREFTITAETRMGTKRAGSSGGFVTILTELVNTFYATVAEGLRSGRES